MFFVTFILYSSKFHFKMAKVMYGAGTIDQRNKIAGWVYSKNRYGGYIRKKVSPVNPQTTHQMKQRQMLGNLSSGWRGLTEAQRQSWIDAAASFPYIDVFGQQIILAGNALYIALNKNLLNAGSSTIDTAPTPQGIATINSLSVAAVAGTPSVILTIDPSTLPADTAMFVYATPPTGAGINFVKNKFRLLGTSTITSGSADITTLYTARFGNPVVGKSIFVRIAFVSTVSGEAGVPIQAKAIPTA